MPLFFINFCFFFLVWINDQSNVAAAEAIAAATEAIAAAAEAVAVAAASSSRCSHSKFSAARAAAATAYSRGLELLDYYTDGSITQPQPRRLREAGAAAAAAQALQ